MGNHRRRLPLWASKLAESEASLKHLQEELEDLPKTTLSDKELASLGIEVYELDTLTGAACHSTQPFFMPRTDSECMIANTPRNPDNPAQDTFTDYRLLRRQGISVNMDLQTHLAIAFQDYAFDLAGICEPQKQWRSISQRLHRDRKFQSSKSDRYSFYVNSGAQSIYAHQCHQHVWMESNDEPVEDRPMLAELIVLVSWIQAGMRVQRKLRSCWARKALLPSHHIFPTLVVSFQPRARARVLYGYYDGKLRIQMSKHLEFDVPEYVEHMDSLLKWAWPKTCGLTTRIMPLPTIAEHEDEGRVEDLQVCRLSKLVKQGWKDKLLSLAAMLRKKSTSTVETHKCEFET